MVLQKKAQKLAEGKYSFKGNLCSKRLQWGCRAYGRLRQWRSVAYISAHYRDTKARAGDVGSENLQKVIILQMFPWIW